MGPSGVAACVDATFGFSGILKVYDWEDIELGFLLKVFPPKVEPLKFSYKLLPVA